MDHANVARMLSLPKREILIQHIDGGAWIDAPVIVRNAPRQKAVHALMDDGLIRYSGGFAGGSHRYSGRSSRRSTRITDDGRMVLAFLLASYAESLIRAGCGVHSEADGPLAKTARRVAERVSVPLIADCSSVGEPA